MFTSCTFAGRYLNPWGHEEYQYQLVDSCFSCGFLIEEGATTWTIVSKLIEIYEARKLHVASNLALYFIWKYSPKVVWTKVLNDERTMVSLSRTPNYTKYAECIRYKVKLLLWARGIYV
jgi:hypothetical protein